MSRSDLLGALVAVAVLSSARAGLADSAASEAAFLEAKRLMAAGRIAEACPKFELSHREDPQIGSLLNLADCHEQLGKLATAWAEFRAAMELAKQRNDSREQFARERSQSLASRAPSVKLVDERGVAGLRVELDGRDVSELVGVAIPVDPGEHLVVSRAEGTREARTTIEVARAPRVLVVHVPLDSPQAAPGEPAAGGSRRTRRTLALATSGAGLALAAVGLYVGKLGFDRWDASRDYCDDANRCDPMGAALVDDARAAARSANVLVGLGALAVTAGVVLWATAPAERGRPGVSARAIAAPGQVAGALIVRF